MTQEKWEPGTVALVSWHDDPPQVFVRRDGRWRGPDGDFWDDSALKVRPLLVLDPDNPDQMRELAEHIRLSWGAEIATHSLSSAVRAMLPKPTPAKPAEPTGLGAVVEDADGKWVCVDNLVFPWREWTSGEFRDWADFSAAVKVLSEGVTT